MKHAPKSESTPVTVRQYKRSDAADTPAAFIDAVTGTASADYTAVQVQAWAQPGRRNLTTWHESMRARNSIVAIIEGELAGFSDVNAEGYIDMMFVSPRHARCGVARQLLMRLEDQAHAMGLRELTADVSITARPFCERCGFTVEAEQHPVKEGVEITNYKMRKQLPSATQAQKTRDRHCSLSCAPDALRRERLPAARCCAHQPGFSQHRRISDGSAIRRHACGTAGAPPSRTHQPTEGADCG